MGLSAEQFKEIIRSLKYDSWARRSVDKRDGPRVGLRCPLTIKYGTESHITDVWLRDVSASGIGIVCSRAMEQNAEFVAEFPLCNGRNLSVLYQVAHCRALSKDLYSIGGRLSRIIADSNDWAVSAARR